MFQDPWFYAAIVGCGAAFVNAWLAWHWFSRHADLWLAVKAEATDRAKAEKAKQALAQQQAKPAPAKPLDIHIGGHKVASFHMPAVIKVGE